MFGNVPARAVVIEGSLALPLLGIAGLLAGLHAFYPRWANWLVAANATTVLILYLPALDPAPGSSYSAFAALASVASLGGFLALAFGWSPGGGAMASLRRSVQSPRTAKITR